MLKKNIIIIIIPLNPNATGFTAAPTSELLSGPDHHLLQRSPGKSESAGDAMFSRTDSSHPGDGGLCSLPQVPTGAETFMTTSVRNLLLKAH